MDEREELEICRRVVHALPYGIVVANRAGSTVFASPQAKSLLQDSSEGDFEARVRDLLSAESAKGTGDNGAAGSGVSLLKLIGDRAIPVVVTTRELGSSGESNDETLLVLVDATDTYALQQRHHADEQALETSEERLRLALKAAQMGTWYLDLSSQSESIDESFSRLFGLGPEDRVKTIRDLYRFIHDDDRQRVRDAFRESIEHHAEFHEEFRIIGRHGEMRWLSCKGQVGYRGDLPVFLAGACVDITSSKKIQQEKEQLRTRQHELLEDQVRLTEEALGRTREELRALAASLFTAQEEERRRIARDLHDDLVQRLAAVQIEIVQLGRSGAPILGDSLLKVSQDIAALTDDVRHMAHHLHPAVLDDLGLAASLDELVQKISKQTAIELRDEIAEITSPTDAFTATCLYRVAQEALRNAIKHSGATEIRIKLESIDEELQLTISDNGRGFHTTAVRGKGGLGLVSMEERMRLARGVLNIESSPGKGTKVTATVPAKGLRLLS